MPSILVVEPDSHSVERINAALRAEGWIVRAVPSVDHALQAAGAEKPDLVMAATDLPGFEVLVFSFSRGAGGPGLLGLAPAHGGGLDSADARLAKPFTDQQVVLAARQALLAKQKAAAPAPVTPEQKLTSQDIFGDMLAEVEEDFQRPGAAPAAPAPVAPPERPAPPPLAGDDVQRRLEKTLSGMLGGEPKPRPAAPPPAAVPAAPAPPRRPEPAADNVDALLSKTLSNLDLGKTKTGVRPPAPAAPVAPAPPPVAAPVPPPVSEGTGVRRGKPVGDFDFSELEELARTTRPGVAPVRTPVPPAQTSVPTPQTEVRTAPTSVPAVPTPVAAPPEPVRPAPTPAPVFPEPVPDLPEPVWTAPPAPAPPPLPVGASVAPSAPSPAATQRIPVFADEPADQGGERFGQYTLLERIAVGGMAEVWKARMRGVEGFQKTVAIKRILPHMTDNAEFVGMFIDEAKLAAQLTHPNIVHIYDLGRMGRDYYIAMEYVEGKDLRSLLNAASRRGIKLPLGLAVLIAARVASALDYAHRKRDFEDKEMGIVHRDVSPQNILLTGEGDVKLCDFGIAKAVAKAGHTQMGALKGKLQYMSPEQAWGRAVDARSDLFSLGAVLFEMVTGERLFTGDSEISVLESVRQGRVRSPRQVESSVPLAVDEIVMKALAQDPQARFQTAGELKQRLESVLVALSPSPGPTDLAAFIQRVLDPSSVPAPAPAMPILPAAIPVPAAAPAAPAWPAAEEPAQDPFAALVPPGPEAPVEPVAPLGEVVIEEEGGRKSRTFLYVAIAAAVVVAILAFYFLNRRRSAPPPTEPAPQAAPQPAPSAATDPANEPVPQSQVPAVLPAAQTPPAGAAGTNVDLQAMMDKQLAAKEEELRKRKEKELQELEKQIAANKAAAQPPPTAPQFPAPAAAAPEPAAKAEPETTPPPPPAPAPEPVKVQEKAPDPEPAKRDPDPEPEAPRARLGDLVQPGPGVTLPQLVSFPNPEYPPMARNLRVQGVVVVSVLVDENGQVQDVRMAEPIKQKVGLNEAAIASARSARYRPATKDGVRVKMWTRLRIPFKL